MRDMIGILLCLVLWSLGLGASCVSADVLELRDGRTLDGQFRGATQQAVRFESDGSVQVVPVDEIVAVTFQRAAEAPGSVAPAPAAPTPAPTAKPATETEASPPAARSDRPAARRVQLPAGTRLRIRLQDSLDPRQSTEGDRFAALLDGALVSGDTTLVPDRATVYGRISAASPTGPPLQRLRLELTSLQISGEPREIVTGNQEQNGSSEPVSDPSGRIASGRLLEFRLLQPVEWVVEAR